MSAPRDPLRRIAIAGGGQLGVLAAIALRRALPVKFKAADLNAKGSEIGIIACKRFECGGYAEKAACFFGKAKPLAHGHA